MIKQFYIATQMVAGMCDICYCCPMYIIIMMSVSLFCLTFYLPFNLTPANNTDVPLLFYFTSALSYNHKIIISRLICAPGHGKSIVDGARSSFRWSKIVNFGTNWSVCQPVFLMFNMAYRV